MKRVTGIGGIFFNANDPVKLRAWYKQHLGIDVQEWGGAAFDWTDATGNPTRGTTAWLIGAADSKKFAPRKATLLAPIRLSLARVHGTVMSAASARSCDTTRAVSVHRRPSTPLKPSSPALHPRSPPSAAAP